MSFSPSPAAVVQAQLDAYNARDVEALLATYSADAKLLSLDGAILATGHAELRQRFVERFSEPQLHARLLSRVVMDRLVTDHEVVTRNFRDGSGTVEMLCLYEVEDGLIQRAWFAFGPRQVGAA